MSHVQVVQEALDDKLSNILIFEDDVQFVNYDEKIIEGALEQLFSLKWDMFYLGSSSNCHFKQVGPNLLKTLGEGGLKATHAYALNSTVFHDILAHNWIWNIPNWQALSDDEVRLSEYIDKFYQDILISKSNCYHINPIQCVQRESYSNVRECVMDYSKRQVERFNSMLPEESDESICSYI